MATSSPIDGDAEESLVRRYLPLAHKLARRYGGRGEPLDDLVQVASLGLLKAARRYDETRGIPFPAYAIPLITGELKRHFRDRCWPLHVPRGAKDRAAAVNLAVQDGLERAGTPPTTAQLSDRFDLPEREIAQALEVWSLLYPQSLDAPAGARPNAPLLAEQIGCHDRGYDSVDTQSALVEALRRLPMVERRIVCLRYLKDLSQVDIAAHIGVSQMQVSRVLRRTTAKLRGLVDPDAQDVDPDAASVQSLAAPMQIAA